MSKPRVSDKCLVHYLNSVTDPLRKDIALDLLDARAQIAELAADARRYRAIRDRRWEIDYSRATQMVRVYDSNLYLLRHGGINDLDAAVDAAIEATKEVKK